MDELQIHELTPPGAGGVSVVRLTGSGALTRLRELGVSPPPVGELRVARLVADGEALDEALVLVRSEHEVELHLHGSPPLVRRLMRGEQQAPSASIEDEARRRLVNAPCELAARILLDQAEGALRRDLQAALESTDEGLVEQLEGLLERSRAVARALSPTRVLLAGPVNAGKSTLFNAMVGGERAITSEVPGTTRDLLEEPARLGPWPIVVVDGAGLRSLDGGTPEARVERAGQELVVRRASEVDWVLWLDPPGSDAEPPRLDGPRLTRLASRADQPGADPAGLRALKEPAEAVAMVSERFRSAFGLPLEPQVAGQGVVFEPADLRILGEALESGAAGARRALLELLARGRTPDVAG